MKIKLSELRQIVSTIIKEEVQNAAPDVNWQKIYSGLKDYGRHSLTGQYGGEVPILQLTWGKAKYTRYMSDFVEYGKTDLKISSSFNETINDWALGISNYGLGFEALDSPLGNQNLKKFESMIGSIGFRTDSKHYMRKTFTKGGKSTAVIIYKVSDWLKHNPDTVISTVKSIIGSMQSSGKE
jgi:hypothetical protein